MEISISHNINKKEKVYPVSDKNFIKTIKTVNFDFNEEYIEYIDVDVQRALSGNYSIVISNDGKTTIYDSYKNIIFKM